MDDDEALVFKVTRDKNGEDKFEIELDDAIVDAVFAEYNRLLDEAIANKSNENSNSGSQSTPKSNKKLKSSKKGFKAAVGTIRKTSKIAVRVVYTAISVAVLLFGILFASIGNVNGSRTVAIVIGVIFAVIGLVFTVRNIKKFKDIK